MQNVRCLHFPYFLILKPISRTIKTYLKQGVLVFSLVQRSHIVRYLEFPIVGQLIRLMERCFALTFLLIVT